MSKWDDLFEIMINSIASDLGLEVAKTREGYMLTGQLVNEAINLRLDVNVGFMYFIGRDGKMKITMSSREFRRVIDLGSYTMEELEGRNSKARRAIMAQLNEDTKPEFARKLGARFDEAKKVGKKK